MGWAGSECAGAGWLAGWSARSSSVSGQPSCRAKVVPDALLSLLLLLQVLYMSTCGMLWTGYLSYKSAKQ
jgi:hypothetical protein